MSAVEVKVGQVWKVNDSNRVFMVTAIVNQHAEVISQDGKRPRRILLGSLRPSHALNGYTLIEDAP